MTHYYHPVPVSVAVSIAENFQKSMVVILCYDPVHQKTHTTTYGVSAWEKEQAAAVGEICALAVGSDLSRKVDYEDFHKNYDPALYRESLELLKLIRARNGCTPPMCQQADRILKAAGWALREG